MPDQPSNLCRVRVSWGQHAVRGTLWDTPTARQILKALPCTASANTWGEEVYFRVKASSPLEPDAQQVVPPGTICFWVEGHSLAIPFGPTPVSQGSECRLVTRVNLLGAIEGDPKALHTVRDGDEIRVERCDA